MLPHCVRCDGHLSVSVELRAVGAQCLAPLTPSSAQARRTRGRATRALCQSFKGIRPYRQVPGHPQVVGPDPEA